MGCHIFFQLYMITISYRPFTENTKKLHYDLRGISVKFNDVMLFKTGENLKVSLNSIKLPCLSVFLIR